MTPCGIGSDIPPQRLPKELSHALPGQRFTVLTALFGHALPGPSRLFRRPCPLRNYADTRS